MSAHPLLFFLWSIWIFVVVVISSTITTTATKPLGVPLPLLRAGPHRHAFKPTLLGVLLGRRVLAGLGGALLFLRPLLTLTFGFSLLLLRSGGTGAAVIPSG